MRRTKALLSCLLALALVMLTGLRRQAADRPPAVRGPGDQRQQCPNCRRSAI